MGTNVQLGSPVCFDRNSLATAGVGFMSENIDYMPRTSRNHLILSDSGIHLDLFHEDDDLADLNNYSLIETKDRLDLAPMSPSYNDVGDEMMKNGPSSSSQNLDASGLPEKGLESSMSSSDCSGKGGTVHRSKGRPTKLTNNGLGSCSNSRSIIQCPVCSKNFNNSSALAKHKLIHSEERKYSCVVCSKAFKRQDHLNGHMMTHSSKKPYECKYLNCDKSYCDQRSLRRHIENHHQHYLDVTPPTSGRMPVNSGDSVFQFDGNFLSNFSGGGIEPGCGSLLTSPVSSVGMSPTSSGQKSTWPFGYNPLDEPKPVKCVVCDRRFKNLPALNGHMRLHGGFVKKELAPDVEKRPEDLAADASKTENVDSKDPSLQSLHSDWSLSTAKEMTGASKLFRVKQEDVTTDQTFDETSDIISNYPDYLHSSGRLQISEQEYRRNCFAGAQLPKLEMLPAMEDLHLKDNVELQISIGKTQQLFGEALSEDSTFAEDRGSNCQKLSSAPQCSPYVGNKFGVSDNRLACFSSQSGDSKPVEVVDSGRVGSDQQTAAALSKYRMLGSSGNVLASYKNLSVVSGSSLLCGSPDSPGHLVRRNIMGSKMRKSSARPLTPSYAVPRSYGSVLPCSASSTHCDSSTPCTPLSPFAGRAVYPTNHNQSQSSLNSTIFEFPPTSSRMDNSILNRSATPIHPSYGLAQQHTPHTPLSPYTPQPNAPYTPKNSASSSRLSRFQFPPSASGTKESGSCESPYSLHQKSAYHPYNHQSSLPSPRYTQLHHHHQLQQLKSDNFEHDVMQMNKEIEQHLQQLIEEDTKKTVLQSDSSFLVQQHDSDLYRQQKALCETEQKLQLGAHCLGSGQPGIGETPVCLQDQSMNQQISFGKYLTQQGVFLDEKMDQEGNVFDMDLELDPLNMLNLSATGNILDKKSRFNETSIDATINDLSQLDVIAMLMLDGQYGGVSTEMAIDEIPNVDILNGQNEMSRVNRDDSLEASIMVSKVATGGGAAAPGGGDRCVQQSVPKWMNREILPRHDVSLNVRKDEMFLNPNQLHGFKKKKRRPDPIIIPPCVNNFQTVTTPNYSPNVVGCLRKNLLPPSHPPPPYTALPIKGPAKDDHLSFQMPFDIRTPMSAPTFHYIEDGVISDQTNGMIRREKLMFSWDQNSVDSLIETDLNQFPASSCYELIPDRMCGADQGVRLPLRGDSSQDELGRFGAAGGSDLDHQEHRIWKTDELNGYRPSLLEKGNML